MTFFMLSPVFLVVLFSFGSNKLATMPIGAPTVHWYLTLFADERFWAAVKNSATITCSVGLVSTVIGTSAALAMSKFRPRHAEMLTSLLSLPVMLPPLVLAIALATTYAALGVKMGVLTVIPSHLIFTQPFVILIIYAQMSNFNFAMLDSARDLGASPIYSFLTIILPIIRPTLIGAALIAMSVSLDDFVITFFTIGSGMTLPTMVWGMLRTSFDPSINALGALILVATITASAVALKITQYRG